MPRVRMMRPAGSKTAMPDKSMAAWAKETARAQERALKAFPDRFFPERDTVYPVPDAASRKAFLLEQGLPEAAAEGAEGLLFQMLAAASGVPGSPLVPEGPLPALLRFDPFVRGGDGEAAVPLAGSDAAAVFRLPEGKAFLLKGAVADPAEGTVEAVGLLEGDFGPEAFEGRGEAAAAAEGGGFISFPCGAGLLLPDREFAEAAERIGRLSREALSAGGPWRESAERLERAAAMRKDAAAQKREILRQAAEIIAGFGLDIVMQDPREVSGFSPALGDNAWECVVSEARKAAAAAGLRFSLASVGSGPSGTAVRRGENRFDVVFRM